MQFYHFHSSHTAKSSQPLVSSNLLSVSYLPILDSVCKWNHTVGGLFDWLLSHHIFKVHPYYQHVLVLCFFLLINNSPFDGYTRFYLSIYLLMDICALSTFLAVKDNTAMNVSARTLYGHVLILPSIYCEWYC